MAKNKKKKDRGGGRRAKADEQTTDEKNAEVLDGVTVDTEPKTDVKDKAEDKAEDKPKPKAKAKPKAKPKDKKPEEKPKEKDAPPPKKKGKTESIPGPTPTLNAKKELKPVMKDIKEKEKGFKEKKGRACKLRIAPEEGPELRMYLGHRGKKDKIEHRLTLSDMAERQVLKRFDIPLGFLQRLNPALRADLVNWFFSTLPKKEKWVLKVQGNFIRAFITDGKATFDHKTILRMIAPNLPAGLLLDWWKIRQGTLHIRLVMPAMQFAVKEGKPSKDLFAGLHIMSNDVGAFSLKIDFVIWRETGSAGIIPLVEKKRLYRAGFPKDEEAMGIELVKGIAGILSKVGPAMEELRPKIQKAMKKKATAKNVPVWVEKLRKKYRFASKIAEKTVERFESEEDTGWGAILAFAHVAGTTKDPMARYDLECLAGLFLDVV